MKRGKNDSRSTFQALALVSQLGLTMVTAIGLPTAFGIWLDRKFGTAWFTVLLFIMGTVAGGQSVYRMIRKIYGPEEKEQGSSGEEHGDHKKD